MKRYAAPVILLTLLACSPGTPSPAGLWAWHEPWESAPEEIVQDTGPQWTAPALVVRFCPDGRFRMASGVFYRAGGRISLGSSDGLRLYEGRWSKSWGRITVQYRLADAEIRFTGMKEAMDRELTEHPEIQGRNLLFTYRAPEGGREVPIRFEQAASLPDQLEPRFVECSGARPGASPR
jgi:hypothetical protein